MNCRSRLCIFAVMLAAGTWTWAFAGERTLGELFENPERYHGVRVTVTGIVTRVTTRASAKGDRYYAFNLSDGMRTVAVFGAGPPPCAVGVTARVSGSVELTAGRPRLAGINATEVKCLPPKESKITGPFRAR